MKKYLIVFLALMAVNSQAKDKFAKYMDNFIQPESDNNTIKINEAFKVNRYWKDCTLNIDENDFGKYGYSGFEYENKKITQKMDKNFKKKFMKALDYYGSSYTVDGPTIFENLCLNNAEALFDHSIKTKRVINFILLKTFMLNAKVVFILLGKTIVNNKILYTFAPQSEMVRLDSPPNDTAILIRDCKNM